MKILISGANSKVASALIDLLLNETDDSLVLLSSKNLEEYKNLKIKTYTTNVTQINTLKKICYTESPDVIVIGNGVSNIALCESDKRLAWTVNVSVVENFLTISRVLEAHMIILSTDQVFDGRKGPYTEEDKPNPQNYFGKTKHTAENTIITNLLKSTVIRTSMIYGCIFNSNIDFVDEIIAKFKKNDEIIINEGIFTNPTFVDDIALAILKIIKKQRYGIYNVAGSDIINNFEIYKQIAETFNLKKNKLVLTEYKPKTFAQRLNNKFGLITIKSETDLGLKLTSFQNGLIAKRYKKELIEKKL